MRTADQSGPGGPARDILDMARAAGIEETEENLRLLSKEFLLAREMRKLAKTSKTNVCQACERGYIVGAWKEDTGFWRAPIRAFLAWRLSARPYHGDSDEVRERKMANAQLVRELAVQLAQPIPEPEPAEEATPEERRIAILRERARRVWGEQEQP